jgi:hypothetical protein
MHALQVHAAAEEGVQIGNGDDIPAGQIRWSVEWQARTATLSYFQ